jgi:hypothetical protein
VRRTGHLAILDANPNMLYVANGMKQDGTLLDDLWVLDLEGRSWTCIYGQDSWCQSQAESIEATNAMAFGTQAGNGLYRMVFGGLGMQTLPCDGKPNQYRSQVVGRTDMKALNLATLQWQSVQLQGRGPPGLAFSSLVELGEQAGYKQPLMLIGGGSFDCLATTPPSCMQPQLTDGVWIMDAAIFDGGPSSAPQDLMASFDGVDDVIVLPLPLWCSKVTSMSVFAADMWMFYTATGKLKVILLDAYQGDIALLRWYATSERGSIFVTLLLNPGKVHMCA